MTTADDIVLQMVTTSAEKGLPCPSNRDIADRLDLSSTSGSVTILKRLATRGLITIEIFQCERRVTIAATGRCTKACNTTPHWRDVPEAVRKPERFPPMPRAHNPRNTVKHHGDDAKLERVDRDPCWRCGARGDLGCEHKAVTS